MTTKNTKNTSELQHEGGNTSSPSRDIQSRKWCITINNYSSKELQEIQDTFKYKKWKYIIGEEIGLKCETPHLQIYFESRSPIKFSYIKKLFPKAHIEKARGTIKQNVEYCSKENNYTTNIDLSPKQTFNDKLKQKIMNKKYKNVKWYKWQQDILNLIKTEPDDRTIHWYYETKGNVGKSFLAKFIAMNYNTIIAEGKKNDIFNQVKGMLDDEKEPKIIILDICRHNEEFTNYGVLESLKNGMMYSGKYEGGQCIFDDVHVIVFSNHLPQEDKMSKDRWHIVEINNE